MGDEPDIMANVYIELVCIDVGLECVAVNVHFVFDLECRAIANAAA